MKKAKQLVMIGFVLALAAYAARVTFRGNLLQSRLARLEASHRQVQQKYRGLRQKHITDVGPSERAFGEILAVVEERDGMDIMPTSDGITRHNKFYIEYQHPVPN